MRVGGGRGLVKGLRKSSWGRMDGETVEIKAGDKRKLGYGSGHRSRREIWGLNRDERG